MNSNCPKRGFTHMLVILLVVGLGIGGIVWFLVINFGPTRTHNPALWDKLKTTASREPEIYVGDAGGVRLISGNFIGYQSFKDPAEAAITFIENNASLWGIRDVRNDLVLKAQNKVSGFTSVKFNQTYNLVPVFGAEMVVRVTKDFEIDSVSSTFVSNINISTVPQITKPRAIELSAFNPVNNAELVIYSPAIFDTKGTAHLAWQLNSGDSYMLLDAITGKELFVFSTSDDALQREVYNNLATPAFPGTQVFAEQGQLAGVAVSTEAINAYNFAKTFYDYFYARHDRDGFDGKGGVLTQTTNYRLNPAKPYNNASWSGYENRARYGLGWANSLDVITHELTHGFVESTANLIYSGESGALEESIADLFASFIDFYNGKGNWTMGEGNGTPLRDLKMPAVYVQPETYEGKNFISTSSGCTQKNDYCGVHKNGSITSKAVQLMVDGGFSDDLIIFPLGVEKTERLLFYVVAGRITGAAKFMDFRNEVLDAARGGFEAGGSTYSFSSKEICAIMNAFASVGLGSADKNCDGIEDNKKQTVVALSYLDITPVNEVAYLNGCAGDNTLKIYTLPAIANLGDVSLWGLDYTYAGDSKVYSGKGSSRTVLKADAGELKDAGWYLFTIEDFPKTGSINYKIFFTINGSKYYSEEKSAKVLGCVEEIAVDSAETTPKPDENTLIIHSTADIDGFLSSNGRTGDAPIAGEYSTDATAFLSFDITSLPKNARLTSATLSLDGALVTGEPFSLGKLTISNCQYDEIDSQDYTSLCVLIKAIASLDEEELDVLALVKSQRAEGNTNFGVRLAFENALSANRTTDYLTFPSNRISLILAYTLN